MDCIVFPIPVLGMGFIPVKVIFMSCYITLFFKAPFRQITSSESVEMSGGLWDEL